MRIYIKKLKIRHLALLLITVTVFLLYFFRIEQEGYSNPYYSAAVKSMLKSWHNFFYISFDPEGYVSVDKPPLGLWIQALSAFLLGFKVWALILPQILASVISIFLMYITVRRDFGETAGLISAFILAITPIMVATGRTNNLDSLLLMFVLSGTWYILIAAERGSLKYLILSMFFIALGFNVKMLQAFMVLPAFYAVYFFTASLNKKTKIIHLLVATSILLAVSFSWALIVDLTPPEKRPYAGGSRSNSVIELIIGYNGIMRILPPPPSVMDGTVHQEISPPPPGGKAPPGHNPLMETGYPGIFRLFNRQLAGQIIWLFPLALASLFILLKKEKNPEKRRQSILWALWLIPGFFYFSISGFFHRYYLIMLAPPISALTASGLIEMEKNYFKEKNFFLPYSLAMTALFQGFILTGYPGWPYLGVLIAVISAISAIVMLTTENKNKAKKALIMSATGLFIPLLIWASTPVIYGTDPRLPFAGPELALENNKVRVPFIEDERGAKLIDFLQKNKQNEGFLIAVPDANFASEIILKTDYPVMAVGGFTGSDRILTIERLEKMVTEEELKFFLIINTPDFPELPLPSLKNKGVTLKEVNEWVIKHGIEVPANEWKTNLSENDSMGEKKMKLPEMKLYDLSVKYERL